MEEREYLEFWQRVEGSAGGFFLRDAMDLTDNGDRKLPSSGAIRFNHQNNITKISPYATFNSPIHCLTGFPAETINKNGAHWEENGESNGMVLKSKTQVLPVVNKQFIVETDYDFPAEYDGPPYKKRSIWFDNFSQEPVKVEMEYQDGRKDIGIIIFQQITGDGKKEVIMKIDWKCQYGPNQMNINFF